eukprot:TRINITY_DN3560_c0_g1_i3.p1 TRINITY_DN3560_c0_g1~~TRINITY_DN3560_c0_g1_i3.p1  ORF type:complete len:372 (+),score=73.78 TRINITY_DN3560_c0_g1_i3:106-1221(+)
MGFQRVGVIVAMGLVMSACFLLLLNGQLFSAKGRPAHKEEHGKMKPEVEGLTPAGKEDLEVLEVKEVRIEEVKEVAVQEEGPPEKVVEVTVQEEGPPEKVVEVASRPQHPRPEVEEMSTKSVALVIMEGAQRQGIDGAILSVIKNTPYNWPLYVIFPKTRVAHFGPWIESLSFNQLAKEQQRPVTLRDMPDKYYGQSQNTPASDQDFWNSFTEEWILLFQADSSMCGHPTIHLKDFFKYDYMGAPWRQFSHWDNEGNGADYYGHRVWTGNGGFSLRRRAWMIECLNRGGFRAPEDTFFALCTQQHGKAASTHEAMPFSSEQIATPGGALGIHGICTYRFSWGCDPNWVGEWLRTCPESAFLFPNNNRCPQC